MIERSDGYVKAIVGDARRILIKAIIDIIGPDIQLQDAYGDSQSRNSRPEQLHDKIFKLGNPLVTLEKNRWVFNQDNSFEPTNDQQIGYEGNALSGDNGIFSTPVWVEQPFTNVSILQAFSLYFSTADYDGIPVDFTVEVKQGGTTYFSDSLIGNTKDNISFSGFTVYDPDAIRLTVTKWSLPNRRLRVAEIYPGLYEEWDGSMLAQFDVKHQGDISCLSLPYGTCTLRMDNLDRRFEPRNKSGIFQSIEERQAIDVSIGTRLDDGTDEYKPVCMFYQYSGGWKTGDNGLTMQWNLVDIIGLLAGREFIPPSELPKTLEGWIKAIVSQLGVNFEDRYHVDPEYAGLSVQVREAKDVTGKKCGDILMWVCMATGTWPRADAETGYLTAEPLWNEGNKLTLDNMNDYPVMKSNGDIAAIIFTLNDGNKTQFTVSGNNTAASETRSVNNPFIQTQEQALTAARMILAAYGGNQYEITGRGDPSSEIGDVDTIWLNESTATTARRIQQTFTISNGVLQGCKSVLLQADGSFLFENRVVLTKSQTWTAPDGAKEIRYILVGKGQDGTAGSNGTWDSAGSDGADGQGGKVLAGTIRINANQSFKVVIDDNVSFGNYSSENGQVFPYGYTDIASGDSFGRTGVYSPKSGTGDGGKGGVGGVKGNTHTEYGDDWSSYTVIDNNPGAGSQGVKGASGCVVLYWDKTT